MELNLERIAKIAHEINAAYCRCIGDNSQVSWDEAAEWQKKSAIDGVQFRIVALAQGKAPNASAQHDAWLADKIAAGWIYGPVKDAEKKQHPCIVPYDQLPAEQRMKDYLFGAVVDAFVECQND